MATQNQIKKRHKYSDKNPQIKKGDIRLNLGEFNEVSLENLDSNNYSRTLIRAQAKNQFTRSGGAYWFKNKEEALTTF